MKQSLKKFVCYAFVFELSCFLPRSIIFTIAVESTIFMPSSIRKLTPTSPATTVTKPVVPNTATSHS